MDVNLNNAPPPIPETSGTSKNPTDVKTSSIVTPKLPNIPPTTASLINKEPKNITDNPNPTTDVFIKVISGESIKVKPSPLKGAYKKKKQATIFKALKKTIREEGPLRLKEAQEVADQINQTTTSQTITISPYIREPLVNPSRKKGLEKPEEKFSRFISHERFVSSLRNSFTSTLADILSESTPPPPYVIIADEGDKSTNWVVSQTLDIMKTHPPTAIVPRKNLDQYLKDNPSIKHVIMMDDGSYSGEQASRYLTKLKTSITSPTSVHICIPYMTASAKELISTTALDSENISLKFSPNQIMHSYQEMANLGYFGYEKMIRPDIKHLLNMDLPSIGAWFSENTKQKITTIYNQLHLLRKDVFKKTDENMISELNKILDDLPTDDDEDWEPIFEEIREDLTEVIKGTERFGVNQSSNQTEIDRYAKTEATESTTPLWMAHKSADGVSTDYISMKKASAKGLAISPYKEDEKTDRIVLVKKLHALEKASKGGNPTLDETYSSHRMGKEEIVISNRGCFIIADNYYAKAENNDDQLILTIEGKKLPFGGKDGAFQYKLKEGDIFSLTKGSETKTFQYENNEIKLIE